MIYEVEGSSLKHLAGDADPSSLVELLSKDGFVFIVSSGKAALYCALAYYRSIGKIKNKNSQILVPKWVGSWVLSEMQKLSFPTTELSDDLCGIMVYHQYGYPQKMEEILEFAKQRNLFVIEDCAHALDSQYLGQRLGTFGDCSIFSFSKFFPSVMGGALYTKSPEMATFLRALIHQRTNGFTRELSFWIKWLMHSGTRDKDWLNRLVEMTYGVYDQNLLADPRSIRITNWFLDNGAIARRRENLNHWEGLLRDRKGFEVPDSNGVLPYVIPVMGKSDDLRKLSQSLVQNEISPAFYQFDRSRNLLKPDFVESLWLPVHSEITSQKINSVIKLMDEK